ncbi:MAG: ABC transporter substrate-binding protein [Actinomycetota bacterium]|nr:ABC transporter substrate-binding protein [Actinomycetota bacterium]
MTIGGPSGPDDVGDRRPSVVMDRRAFLGTSLAAAGAVYLGACRSPGDSPGEEGRPTLRIPGRDFGFPSPFSYFVGPGYTRMSYIYDSLLWVDASGHLVPWLATSYQASPDGMTYAFEIREGVVWHDGRPVTPDDVVFTFEYYAAHERDIAPFVVVRSRDVAQARATGGRGVEVRLRAPSVPFLKEVAARLPIVPRHIWAPVSNPGQRRELEVLVGSGPYRLQSYSGGQGSYLYTANDAFFLGRPFVKRLELAPVDDELTAVYAGELDAGGSRPVGVTPDALRPFAEDDSFEVVEGPEDQVVALYWNLGRGGAMADPRFRQACCHAIDRNNMVKRLLGDLGYPGNPGFLPPRHPFHAQVEQYAFDPDTANRLLDQAGYQRDASGGRRTREGRPLRFELLAPPDVASAVDLVVQALKAIGVELSINPVDFPTLVNTMGQGGYEMAVIYYGNLSGDPDFMRTAYSSRVPAKVFLSAQGYVNRQLDDVADQQRVTADEARRKELLSQMQHIAARDVPLLHLYYPRLFHVFRKAKFDEWAFTPDSGFLSSPYNKELFVTGSKAPGADIRPAE